MPLLKNNAFITDGWLHLGAEDPWPDGGNVSIPFSRLKNEWESLAKFPGQLGTLLSNTDHADDIAHFLPHLTGKVYLSQHQAVVEITRNQAREMEGYVI